MTQRTLSPREQRHHRLRTRMLGTALQPRVSVFRSLTRVTVQLIDDRAGVTLATVSQGGKAKGTKVEQAIAAGKELAEKAKAAGITRVVFDRGGWKYHGRIKALAEALREGGLTF